MSRVRLKDASNHNDGISKSGFAKCHEFKGEIQSISSRFFNILACNCS